MITNLKKAILPTNKFAGLDALGFIYDSIALAFSKNGGRIIYQTSAKNNETLSGLKHVCIIYELNRLTRRFYHQDRARYSYFFKLSDRRLVLTLNQGMCTLKTFGIQLVCVGILAGVVTASETDDSNR